MAINLTDELNAATKKGKIASAKQVYLEGDQENLQQIGDKTHQLEQSIKDISTTGGASTANAVSYNNETSGMTAVNAQAAIDELAAKNKAQDATIATKADAADVTSKMQTEQTRVNAELEKKFEKNSIMQETGDATDKVMSQKAVSDKLSDLSNKIEENESSLTSLQDTTTKLNKEKVSKDNDSDTSMSDNSDELVITDSANKIALKVDKDGLKARLLNICDENGNVVKTITKETFDKIEENESSYGNTCNLQEKKGTYYEIDNFSLKNEDMYLKAEFSTSQSKFGERTLHLFIHGKEETNLTSRSKKGSLDITFSKPIEITESLSFWIYMPTKCFINHRFESIKNPDPYIEFTFIGEGFSETFGIIPQYSLSPSWMLFKILNKNLRGKVIKKVSLSIENNDANPNMDLWLGCFVADQRFIPTINFNMDSSLTDCVNSKFTEFLESNNIPANIVVNFGFDQTKEGQTTGKKLYFNGIVGAGVRNANVSIKSESGGDTENINVITCNYLKKVKGIRYYLENNIISDGNPTRPIIAAQCATNYIDDVLAHALKTCGYRIIRHSNSYNYHSYIDSESCFIGTIGIGFTSNITSTSDLTEEWKNELEASFKTYVDNLIEWGMVGSFFTHEVKTKDELTSKWDQNAITVDVIEDCINYVLEKEKQGLIQFKTLDEIYYNSVNTNFSNN